MLVDQFSHAPDLGHQNEKKNYLQHRQKVYFSFNSSLCITIEYVKVSASHFDATSQQRGKLQKDLSDLRPVYARRQRQPRVKAVMKIGIQLSLKTVAVNPEWVAT